MRLMERKDGRITSLELVEQINIFRKQEGKKTVLQHKSMLGIIRSEFSEEIDEQNILPIEYTDKLGRKKPMYELTLNEAKQVLMRESKFVRKAMIHYIETLEDKLQNKNSLPSNYLDALKQLVVTVEENQKLTGEIKIKNQLIAEYKPKIEYLDIIIGSKSLLTITQIAKDYGLSGRVLNKILKDKGVQFKNNGQWLLKTKYVDKGYTKSETWENCGRTGLQTKWTQKGRLFIHELLTKLGIVAIMDKEVE